MGGMDLLKNGGKDYIHIFTPYTYRILSINETSKNKLHHDLLLDWGKLVFG